MQKYNNPWAFSFKDWIAMGFILFFFYCGLKALHNEQALEVLKAISAPIMVILGGYFTQEVYTQYTQYQSKSRSEEPPL